MVQYQRIFIMIGEKMMFVNQNADAYDRETEEYIVAYLDLLGVTNRIKDYSQDELSMNKLHERLGIYECTKFNDATCEDNADI